MKKFKYLGLLSVFSLLFTGFGYGFSCTPIEAKNTTLHGQGAGSIDWLPGSTKYCILSNGGSIDITLVGQSFTLIKNEGFCIEKSDLPNGTNSFPIDCLSSSCDLGWIFFGGDCNLMTSSECQLEYSLIPIESVDSEYCENNNLCSSSNYGSGDNWSALYINNLQFPGKSNIFVTIPDYIYWDYSSDDSDFNLYVGSGYDQDYIDNIVKINSYQPNSEDFTEIFVGGLTWIMPYIVIVLFIVFVWKLLKRIFR